MSAFGEGEFWTAIPGHEGSYDVSSFGGVRSLDRVVARRCGGMFGGQVVRQRLPGKVLSPARMPSGYPSVNITNGAGKRQPVPVHRLMALAFYGPPPPGKTDVCHADDVKTRNTLDNIRWDTRSANEHDKVRNGRHRNANKTHCANGHEFTPENTASRRAGGRTCRTCQRERGRQYRARKRQRASKHR